MHNRTKTKGYSSDSASKLFRKGHSIILNKYCCWKWGETSIRGLLQRRKDRHSMYLTRNHYKLHLEKLYLDNCRTSSRKNYSGVLLRGQIIFPGVGSRNIFSPWEQTKFFNFSRDLEQRFSKKIMSYEVFGLYGQSKMLGPVLLNGTPVAYFKRIYTDVFFQRFFIFKFLSPIISLLLVKFQ